MSLLKEPPLSSAALSATLADHQSAANFSANFHALSVSQPRVAEVLRDVRPHVRWVFARDKTLTTIDESGRWHAGCSVPTLAARAMLKTLKPVGSVACFIEPPHAAHIREALSLMQRSYAVVCVMRDLGSLWTMLGCDDFSDDIAAGRLWFVSGPTWASELDAMLTDEPGLPTPAQFIRLNVTPDDVVNEVIAASQKIFADHAVRRSREIRSLHDVKQTTAARDARRLCVAASLGFRLWSDSGWTLAELARRLPTSDFASPRLLDLDDPRQASPLALARIASDCDALLTANVARTDLPGVAPAATAWVSWVTTPNIPTADPSSTRDALILADESWREIAIARGWLPGQLHLGAWPVAADVDCASLGDGLALIVDTASLDPPKECGNFSSHVLLWEAIREELLANPFAIGKDVARYLDRRMSDRQISEDGFSRPMFVERLILPAYQQGLAKLLAAAGIPLRLYGRHWDTLQIAGAHGGGEIRDREALRNAIRSAKALLHCWPTIHSNAIDAMDRPVLRPAGMQKDSFVRAAARLLATKSSATTTPGATQISCDLLARILHAD